MDPRTGGGGSGRPGKVLAELRDRLIAFARHARELAQPQGPSGATTRVHLEAAAARGDARARAELDGPPLPLECAHVWTWFLELNAARPITAPPTPLRYADLAVWAQITGRRARAVEVEWLKALDRAWLAPAPKTGG